MTWYGVLGTFGLALVVDYLYVLWTRAAMARQSVRAGISSGLLQIVAATSTIIYVTNPWLLIPNVLGHSLGSYLAVKYGEQDV